MSKKRIEEMLQDCLDGYEAGLTPEECLSAYNGDRAALETLLRQALSLRVAYANSPSETFRLEAREKLMFAAGRDVRHALASEPDPQFVAMARARFLNAAGATAQEALRDVPPPRLAFWINARRRLLEASTSPRPSRRFALALRYGVSAAVVVIALGVATLAPFGGNSPQSADAQLAVLEQQITSLERQTLAGQPVSSSVLLDVTRKINQLTGTLDDEPAIARAEKLEGLHARQQEVVTKQATSDDPALAQAQEELDEAQEKLRLFAAQVASPTQAAALVVPTEPPVSPTAITTPAPTPTREPVSLGQVRTALAREDTTYGLTWVRITTSDLSFVLPDSWRLVNVEPDQNGILTLSLTILRIDTPGDPPVIIIISPTTGEANALIKGNSVRLRGAGPNGTTIAPDILVAATGEVGLALHHFVLSISVSAAP